MRRRTSPIWLMEPDEFRALVAQSTTITQVLAHFGLPNRGQNYRTFLKRVAEEHIDTSHFLGRSVLTKGKRTLAEVLTEGIVVQSWGLKRRLLTAGLLREQCQECGIGAEWNNKRLFLHFNHINGKHTDNRLENLRLLCPNCHSQTENYSGHKSYEGRQNSRQKIACPSCGVLKPMNGSDRVCQRCASILRRKAERPTDDHLRQQVAEFGYTETGRLHGVSDNTIRKWLRGGESQDKT